MENFQSGWMYRIAAEVAIEILVLLDHSHVHALSSEQIAEHHACWSATNNTTRRMNRLVCHGCSQCKATCNFSTKPDLNSGDVDRIRTCIRVSLTEFKKPCVPDVTKGIIGLARSFRTARTSPTASSIYHV